MWLLKPGMTAVIELSVLYGHRNGSGLLKTLLVDNAIKVYNVKLAQLPHSDQGLHHSRLVHFYSILVPSLTVCGGRILSGKKRQF